MGTSAELHANVGAASAHQPQSLTGRELAAYAAAAECFAARNTVGCTGCSYCMPCPAGVNIPAIFQIYNQYRLFGDRSWADVMYNMSLASNNERADACRDCGACEQACPQNLPIRECLREAHATMDPLGQPA